MTNPRETKIPATYMGERGTVTRLMDRNLWWRATGTETLRMFSLRGDLVWRAFPGPADGPGLTIEKL